MRPPSWLVHGLAALVLALGAVAGVVPALAAPADAARPVPNASPGRDRRPLGAVDGASVDVASEPARPDDATGARALEHKPSTTGPTGNDTGTRGTDSPER